MDFVVVGLGLGALAILSGVLLVGWFAGRWERRAAHASCPDDAAHDIAMAAWRRGSGQAMFGVGSAVLLATIGALAGSLTDQTGAFLVTTTATVAALGMLFWAYLYRARNPIPPRRQPHASEPVPRPVAHMVPAPTVTTAPRAPLPSAADAPAPAEPTPAEPAEPVTEVVAAAGEAAVAEEVEAPPEPDTPPADEPAPPAEFDDAARPLTDNANDASADVFPTNGVPVEAPKIVELAAFAARAEKSRLPSATDDGEDDVVEKSRSREVEARPTTDD